MYERFMEAERAAARVEAAVAHLSARDSLFARLLRRVRAIVERAV